jgi:hypothetical protein
LTKANESARGARKKKWILFGIISFIVFIIVVVIIFKFSNNKSSAPATTSPTPATTTITVPQGKAPSTLLPP